MNTKLLCTCLLFFSFLVSPAREKKVLIFGKMTGYEHKSVPEKIVRFTKLLEDNHYVVSSSADAAVFTDANLKQYDVLVFMDCSGDLFNNNQRQAFVNYIHKGGGWLGIHAAPTAEKQWDWYGELVGARFDKHPHVQKATVTVGNTKHPITKGLPEQWQVTDEWYYWFTNPDPKNVTILLSVGETSWKDGKVVPPHPIAWCHKFEKGKSAYIGLSHHAELFDVPEFTRMLLNATKWVCR